MPPSPADKQRRFTVTLPEVLPAPILASVAAVLAYR
ncbi:hypothetical protein Hgul01_05413 [Herpetosiphon gulosus]|uniref:Uncharacterized protein n=1 Tax=Herpetosiphon gulosus TaxID=1973496 RepID=A0ABP9X892_9CHLR